MDNGSCCPTKMEKKQGSCSIEKTSGPSCCGLLIRGAFAGGFVMFVYLTASWMLLPWHMSTMHAFKDEKVVAKMLTTNAPASGVYVLPLAKADAKAPAIEKPFAFVSVKAEGFGGLQNMRGMMGQQFLLCLVLAGLLTCLLKKQTCGCPVGYSMKLGLFVALAHNVPNLIWWHFPVNFSLVGMADDFLAVTLTGLVISKAVLNTSLSLECAPKGTCS